MKLKVLGRDKFDEIIKRKKPVKTFDNRQNNKIVRSVDAPNKPPKLIKKVSVPASNPKVTKPIVPIKPIKSSKSQHIIVPITKPLIPAFTPVSTGPIDILILTEHDWANTGYRFHKCLKLLGLHVEIYKGNTHTYGYPEQAPILDCLARQLSKNDSRLPVVCHTKDPRLVDLITRAKIVDFHASSFFTIPGYEMTYKKKKMVVTHGGQSYRKMPVQNNKIFNEYCQRTIVQCPDLLNLGANNESLCYYPVDTDYIQPNYDFGDTNMLIIGHFPSSPGVKGSDVIHAAVLDSMMAAPGKLKYIGVEPPFAKKSYVPWIKQLAKYHECDIYIETCKLVLHEGVYGEWGNTCLEAAASGCIVITNSLTSAVYQREYGSCPLLIANSRTDIFNHLKHLASLSRDDLLSLKIKFRQWAEEKHSFLATGLRLWHQVYKKQMDLEAFTIQKLKTTTDSKYFEMLGLTDFYLKHKTEK